MIRQVRLDAVLTDALGSISERRVFAFGTHTLALSTDYPALGANTMATAAATGQKLRVVMDELLVGNYLEEIACRAPVDADAYDFVPLGTTPDDIAKCAVAKDVLPQSCPGGNEHAVCICKIPGGCGEVEEGGPVGVLDVNQDGAADDTRLIPGAMGITCGSIVVPIDINNSYWNPSGDQNRPAMGGFDALGPALIIEAGPAPNSTLPALPTNLECGLTFAPDIVDKQNNRICAPPNGDVLNGTCTPGDLASFKFKTEALRVSNNSFADGDTGVDRGSPVVLTTNAPSSMATFSSITVLQAGQPFTGFTITQPLPLQIRINWSATLMPNTMYEIRIANTLADLYDQPLPMPVTYTFTTGS
jgi:hypothetical protein